MTETTFLFIQFLFAFLNLSLFLFQVSTIWQSNGVGLRRLQIVPTSENKQVLKSIYMSYPYKEAFHHWLEFSDAYERHFARKRIHQNDIKLLEIGVQSGGSINVWKDYFGETLFYVGIDINKNCKYLEKLERKIHVEIGTQSDVNFLSAICSQYGPFDIIIDDGSHVTRDILISLKALFTTCLKDKGIYAIEDLHAPAQIFKGKPNMTVDGKDIYAHFADFARDMSAYFKQNRKRLSDFNLTNISPFSGHITRMEFYDSMLFFHYSKSLRRPLTELKKGNVFIPDVKVLDK